MDGAASGTDDDDDVDVVNADPAYDAYANAAAYTAACAAATADAAASGTDDDDDVDVVNTDPAYDAYANAAAYTAAYAAATADAAADNAAAAYGAAYAAANADANAKKRQLSNGGEAIDPLRRAVKAARHGDTLPDVAAAAAVGDGAGAGAGAGVGAVAGVIAGVGSVAVEKDRFINATDMVDAIDAAAAAAAAADAAADAAANHAAAAYAAAYAAVNADDVLDVEARDPAFEADVAAGRAHCAISFTAEEYASGLPARFHGDIGTNYVYDRELLGEGGFGEVRRVRGVDDRDWTMAAKIIKRRDTDTHIQYVKRELHIMLKLDHPNICKLIESFTWHKKHIFFHLELCRVDLFHFQQKVKRSHFRSIPQACIKLILHNILTGVRYMHSCNVLHRDLKTENILLTSTGEVKITDFGLGRLMDTTYVLQRRDRRHSGGVGTKLCMSPEMLLGKTDYGDQVDMWGVGIIALELYVEHRLTRYRGKDPLIYLKAINEALGHILDIPYRVRHYAAELNKDPPIPYGAFPPIIARIATMTTHGMPGFNMFDATFVEKMLKLRASERPSAYTMLRDDYFRSAPVLATPAYLAGLIFWAMA